MAPSVIVSVNTNTKILLLLLLFERNSDINTFIQIIIKANK